jgi:hypothetical protein
VGDALRVERACQDAGLECRSREYTHETTSYWKIVGDASVVDGGELVSPPLVGDEWAEQVTKACRALRSAEASVNQRCGLHVHLEVRGFRGYAIRRVYTAWYENQSLIHQLVSPSRRNGRFCVDIDRFDLDTLRERRMLTRDEVRHGLTFLERYKAINGQAYPRYGTLEVRLHQGTMSAKKILAWSELCRSIFTWAKETDVPHRHEDLSTFLRTLEQHGLQRRTAAYLLRRARRIRAQEAESEDARSLRAHERAERERVERERAEAAHHAEAARQADERYALERTEREREHLIYDSSFSPSSTFRRDVRVRPPGNPFIASFRDVMRDDGLGS